MGLGLRILMVVSIILIVAFDIIYMLLSSGDITTCVSDMTSSGTFDLESSQSMCGIFVSWGAYKLYVLGISGLLIVICGLVFHFGGD